VGSDFDRENDAAMRPDEARCGSAILDAGKSPADWVSWLLEYRQINIAERTLREKANRLGACFRIGNAMIITPEQIDEILTEDWKCRSNRTSEARSIGSKAGSNATAARSPAHIDKARDRLQKLARGTG